MAISANTVLEVRQAGSDTNGGGFVTGASGTDWSQQNAAQYSVTDGVTAGSTTITSASAAFGTDVVGNLIYVQGGTGSIVAGWYQITARASSTSITVDRSTGLTAGTGVTLKIGGALASPGGAQVALVSGGSVTGTTVYVKYNASPYVATSATLGVAGGCVSGPAGTYWIGYDTVRASGAYPTNRPKFQVGSGVSTATLFAGTNTNYWIESFILDGNSQTTSAGSLLSGDQVYCKAINCTKSTGGALADSSAGRFWYCEVTNCSTQWGILVNGSAFYCNVHDNTFVSGGAGYRNGTVLIGCIAANNPGNTIVGYNNAQGAFFSCIAYGNGSHGFGPGNGSGSFTNCVAEANGGYGWSGGTGMQRLWNCADYNNTSGRINLGSGRYILNLNSKTGTSSFFTNPVSGDFSLNSLAGGGALLKGAGFPTVIPML